MTDWLLAHPIAHRGLHDMGVGRYENTLTAAKAAMNMGYNIEVDLHPSLDGVPKLFHDHTLDRMTGETGSIRDRTAAELRQISIGGTADCIPTLADLLDLVAGKNGLLLELKGLEGADDGFAEAVIALLKDYEGPVALMSFSHWLLADIRRLGCPYPLGLTAKGDDSTADTHAAAARKYDVDFISYAIFNLPNRFVRDFRATGKPVITWTVRSPEQMAISYDLADQITFEDFLPPIDSRG